MVTSMAASGSWPNDRNWNCVPNGIVSDTPSININNGGMPVLLSPHLTAARYEVPDFLNGSMSDSL